MAWRSITEADVLTRLSGPELETFRSAALADDQADPVADAIRYVVDFARGHIAACSNNRLGASGTVPEKLVGACLDLIAIEIMKRAGGVVIDPQDARSSAAREARRVLERVADCKFAVELPDERSQEEIPTPAATPYIRARRPQFRRDQQEGA